MQHPSECIHRAAARQLESFLGRTCLLPVVALYLAVGEIVDVFDDEPRLAQEVRTRLLAEDVVAYVSEQSAGRFQTRILLRQPVAPGDVPPMYQCLMQQWVAGVFRRHFPDLYRRLPRSFVPGEQVR